jgi:ubiquitin-protein ligase
MSTIRLKRLKADHIEMQRLIDSTRRIKYAATGNPPDRYDVTYHCKGLLEVDGKPVEGDQFGISIVLGSDYPREKPIITVHDRVFHPNFSGSSVCIAAGDWRQGESLADLVLRIGRMIQYQNYNAGHPLNRKYADWALANIGRFPIDPEPLVPEVVTIVPVPSGQAHASVVGPDEITLMETPSDNIDIEFV